MAELEVVEVQGRDEEDSRGDVDGNDVEDNKEKIK